MMNKELTRLIGAVILLVIVAAAYGFGCEFVTAKSAQASSLAAQIAEQSNATSQIAQAKSEVAQLTTQQATIDQYLVVTNDVVPFLEQLQSTGKFLGADVQVASVAANPGTPYGHLDLSLTINGSFDAIARTLGSIEYGPYDTTISSLSFNTSSAPGETASSSPKWTANAIFSIGAQTGAPSLAAPTSTPPEAAATSSLPAATTTSSADPTIKTP